MDADRWARIQELFLGALERPAGECERYLSDLEDDDEVVEKARQLLAAALDPATVLEGSAGDLLSDFGEVTGLADRGSATPEQLIGREVSPYRVIERIGEGGMGAVYVAVASVNRDWRTARAFLTTELRG